MALSANSPEGQAALEQQYNDYIEESTGQL
jgi:hypothetical protein